MSYVQDVMHEKFELIEVLGKYCLFTDLRVAHKDLPAGLYRYDMREGEAEFFGSIEPFVLINHMGAILTKEPFEFEKEYEGDPYIVLDAETQPNFLDEMMTINEYMGSTPEMIRCRHAERDW